MSAFLPPEYNSPLFNSLLFPSEDSSGIDIPLLNNLYLRRAGGSATGLITFNLGFLSNLQAIFSGTKTLPAISFNNSGTDTGLYSTGSNNVSISCNDTQIASFDETSITFNAPVSMSSFLLADGTASNPSLTFTSDPNTGVFLVNQDNLGFSTNGTLRVDITDEYTEITNNLIAESIFSENYVNIKSYQVPIQENTFHCFEQQGILYPPSSSGSQGSSVAVSGDGTYIICSAPNNSVVYVYRKSGGPYSLYQTIIPAIGSTRFGSSVSLSLDAQYLAVGASLNDFISTDAGAVHIYKWNGSTFALQQMIYPSNAVNGNFGASVSISTMGDYIAVGAPNDSTAALVAGSTYVFKRTGNQWTEEGKFYPTRTTGTPAMGTSVSISGDGDYVISGAPFDDEKDTNTGCAYVYSRAGSVWSLATTLYPSIVDTNIRAGVSVAISNDGNYFAMGVPLDDVAGLNAGCVYIYNRIGSVLTQQTILYPSITTGEPQMGEAVSFNPTGQYLLCGAPLEDTVNTNAGSVFIFNRNGPRWAEQSVVFPSVGAGFPNMGRAVAISGDNQIIVAGAPGDDFIGGGAGCSYVYVNNGDTFIDTTFVSAGSATEPSYTFTADKNTGLYSVGADDLGIATNGTLRMDINTTRVRAQLPVYVESGTATAPSYTFNGDTNTGMYNIGADNLGFSTNSTLRMDISDTRVAIAQTTTSTSETTGALTVAGGIGASNRCYLRALTCGEGTLNPIEFRNAGGTTLGYVGNQTYSDAEVGTANDVRLSNFNGGAFVHLQHFTSGGLSFHAGATQQTAGRIVGSDGTNYSRACEWETYNNASTNSVIQWRSRSDNSATRPTYSFFGDANTGMYSAGADQIGFATNSTEALRITDTLVQARPKATIEKITGDASSINDTREHTMIRSNLPFTSGIKALSRGYINVRDGWTGSTGSRAIMDFYVSTDPVGAVPDTNVRALTLEANWDNSTAFANARVIIPDNNSANGLLVQNTTASTSTTTGAVIVSGGIGVAGNSTIGGHLQLNDISTPSPTTNRLYSTAGTLYWNGVNLLTPPISGAITVDSISFTDVASSTAIEIFRTGGGIVSAQRADTNDFFTSSSTINVNRSRLGSAFEATQSFTFLEKTGTTSGSASALVLPSFIGTNYLNFVDTPGSLFFATVYCTVNSTLTQCLATLDQSGTLRIYNGISTSATFPASASFILHPSTITFNR